MKKLNCAVIGLGRIGCGFDDNPRKKTISTHAGAYKAQKNVNLVALCDIDERKLSRYGMKYGVSSLYTNINEMFKNEDLDCVSICTLINSHLEIVQTAAKYGVKAIFLEKPMDESLTNAKKIIRICNEKGIKLQIDHQRRFLPFYHQLRKELVNGTVGEIEKIDVNYVGGIANTGSHLFDILRFLFGEIESIVGNWSEKKSENPDDPNIDGVIKFKSSRLCRIYAFELKNFRIFELDIIGTSGRITVDLTESVAKKYVVAKKGSDVQYNGLVERKMKFKKTKEPIVLGVENLITSVQKNEQVLCDGEDGYASLEAIIAMIESAKKNGKTISLPLKGKKYIISSK